MKTFFTIPTAEEQKEFFNRYASSIKKLSRLTWITQVISAVTEFSIFYAIGYNSFLDLNPNLAHTVGIVTGIGLTLVLELIIRLTTPKAIGELIDRKTGNNWLKGLFAGLAFAAIFSSAYSSWFGSKDIAQALAADPELETTTEQDSINNALLTELKETHSIDSASIAARYNSEITATKAAYDAKISAAKREKQNWRNKGKRQNTSFASKIDEARLKIESLEAEQKANIATLKAELNKEFADLSKTYKADKKATQSEYKSEVAAIDEANKSALLQSESNIKAKGKSFGWITIVCLVFFILIVWSNEILNYHSGIKEVVLPSEFSNRENSYVELIKGLSVKAERWRRKIAAKWTDHSHSDIELPYKTAFEVDRNYLLLEQALEVIQEQQRRGIGFHKEEETKEEFEEAEVVAKGGYKKGEKGSRLNPTFSKGEKDHYSKGGIDYTLHNKLKEYAKAKSKYSSAKSKVEKAEQKGNKVNGNTLNSMKAQEKNMQKHKGEIIQYCKSNNLDIPYKW